MEIERKFLVPALPENLSSYPCHLIEQAYLCTSPVVRIRRQDDDFILTYKGSGMMAREEYNLPLTSESYGHLLPKADGIVITKKRYVIPLDTENLTSRQNSIFLRDVMRVFASSRSNLKVRNRQTASRRLPGSARTSHSTDGITIRI